MPKNIVYDYPTHIAAIHETLSTIGLSKPVSLAGHSMGALLALRYAAEYPAFIDKLLLIGIPCYSSPSQARKDITQSNIFRKLAYYGPTSQALCNVWCSLLRPITKHIAPLYLRHIPSYVAHDTLLHTWQSYAQSMQCIIENQAVTKDLAALTISTDAVFGQYESCRDYLSDAFITYPPASPIRFISFPGTGHQLPVTNPELLVKLLIDDRN
jgi:pimeloyl-ACP methyl ester carboxylesterase